MTSSRTKSDEKRARLHPGAFLLTPVDCTGGRNYTNGMENELELTKKRLAELAKRAEKRSIAVESEFLTPAAQLELTRMHLEPCVFDGGYEQAERRCAVFLPWEGCEWDSRVVCLELRPANERFAETLTHRDYLGALMALGIKRETMGDIVVQGKRAYLFCLDSIAPYICEQLTEVRRTQMRASPCDAAAIEPPEPPKETTVTVQSTRLDALVAAVYKLSRGEAQRLFEREMVLVNSLPPKSPGFAAREGDIVSVRGHGRFAFLGEAGETRKGRVRVKVRIY